MSRTGATDLLESISARLESVTLEREEEEVDELDADETASIRTSETLDSDAERSESSSSSGDSLHTSSLEEADSEADDSLAVDDEGSEYDQLEESGSESDGSEDEEDEDDDEDAGSVDLELEEAQEMANAAISVHSRALRVAAAEGLFVKRKKTVMDVVEVVRAIVNTIGPFAEGPVNADVILEQLRSSRRLLLDDERQFLFEDAQSLLNKYLAVVKYAYPEGIDGNVLLVEALEDEDVYTEESTISLKALVRRLKYGLEANA